ncbi:hypothetical protein AX14_000659 [Amanita brunnescens Koide BX004]|nr:hypothetical protein AX14_000659 [Amanita brunnescens Koide BX004]
MSTVAIGVTDDASAPADDGGTYEEVENEEKIDKRKTTSLFTVEILTSHRRSCISSRVVQDRSLPNRHNGNLDLNNTIDAKDGIDPTLTFRRSCREGLTAIQRSTTDRENYSLPHSHGPQLDPILQVIQVYTTLAAE